MNKYTLLLLLLPQLCTGQRLIIGADAGFARLFWTKQSAANDLKGSYYIAPYINLQVERKTEIGLRYANSQVVTKTINNTPYGRSMDIARPQHDVILSITRFAHQNRRGLFFGATVGYAFYNNGPQTYPPSQGDGFCYGLHVGSRYALSDRFFITATLGIQSFEMSTNIDPGYLISASYNYYKVPLTLGIAYGLGKPHKHDKASGDPATD